MKLVDAACPHCGASLKIDSDSKNAVCKYCGASFLIDDEVRDHHMNIQIFGTKKSSDTRKAERFFKERGIRFQSVDLKEKGLSKGEFNAVMQAAGGLDSMIDPDCKDKDLLALIAYTAESGRAQKVMENQGVLRQPIVRNGKQATIGYAPDVWKTWQ